MYSIFNCKHLDAHFQGSAEVFIVYPFAGHRPLPAPPATHNLIRRKCSKVFIYGCVLQCDKNKLRKRHVRSISGSTVSLPLRPQSTALFERKTCECINWLNMVLYGSTSYVWRQTLSVDPFVCCQIRQAIKHSQIYGTIADYSVIKAGLPPPPLLILHIRTEVFACERVEKATGRRDRGEYTPRIGKTKEQINWQRDQVCSY